MFSLAENQNRKKEPRLLPGIVRSSTQPEISPAPESEHSPSLFKAVPDISYDSNKSQDSPAEPNIHPQSQAQGHPLGLPRVHSLQAIPKLERFMSLDRYKSNVTSSFSPNHRQGPAGTNLPAPPSLFAFRQDSLKGSRILRIPSGQDSPALSRTSSAANVPRDTGAIVIPIDNIEEEHHEHHSEHHNAGNNGEAQNVGTGVVEAEITGGRQHDVEAGEAQEVEIVEDDETDEETYKTAVYRVSLQFIFNLFVIFCYGMGYLFLKEKISVEVVFGIVIGVTCLYIIGLFKTGGYHSGTDKLDLALSFANAIAIIIYAVAALLVVKEHTSTLAPFSFLGFLILFAGCCKHSMETPSPTKVLLLIVKVVIWVEMFLIGLRVEGISMPWTTTFIPLYFSLMILVLSSMLIIIGSLFAFFSIMAEEGVSAKLLIGSMWYVLNALYTATWLAIVTQVVEKLDKGEADIERFLIAGFIHSGVLFFFTLFFWRILCKFQEFEVQSEMLVEDNHFGEDLEGQEQSNYQIKFQVNKEDKTKLVMISSTFYALLNKHMKPKNDKEIEALRKEAERAKLGKVRNALTANTHQNTDHVINMNRAQANAKQIPAKNLDFSVDDAEIRKNSNLPGLKRGESLRSNNNDNLCTVCFDSVPNAVLMECGHGGICYECALELWKKSDNCILCRQKINKILKIVNCRPLNTIKVVESTRKIVERG